MKKKILKFFILACIIVPITVFIVQVDFIMVFQELQKIGLKFIIILLITFVAYLLGTIGWWICLGEERKRISLFKLFEIRQIGEIVGLYNPSSIIGGDVLKSELLKPYQFANHVASESVVISRVTAVLSQLSLLMLSLFWLLINANNGMPVFWRYGLFVVVALLFCMQVLFFYFLYQRRRISAHKLHYSFNLWQRMGKIIRDLVLQTQHFFDHHKTLFWWSYVFFFLHWLVGSMEFYIILYFMGYDILLIESVLLDMGVILIKSVGAFIPGQLGVEELGNKIVLASIGIQAATIWVTVSILRRTRQLCWILVGIVCYIFIRKTDAIKVFKHGNPVRQS